MRRLRAGSRRFCERFDQCAFDPDYPNKPLAYFEPLLRQVFARTPLDPVVLKALTRSGRERSSNAPAG